MSKENMVSVQIPSKEYDAALTKLQEVKKFLKPYLIALQPLERQSILKMSDKTLPFVIKTAEYAQLRKDFAPPFMNAEELAIDLKAVEDLTRLYREVDQLCKSLDDTIMLSGSEAYGEALAYYQSVKQAAKRNIPDAKAIYQDLRKRFEKKSGGEPTGEE